MIDEAASVYVVDDDPELRRSLCVLLKSEGIQVDSFPSAEEFLRLYRPGRPACLLLDLRLGGMSGLKLQMELVSKAPNLRVIVISGNVSVPDAVHATKRGALDILEKPVDPDVLVAHVKRALDDIVSERKDKRDWSDRYATLSPRERQVMERLVAGQKTLQIGKELGISPSTVEKHRLNTFQKMGVDSVVDLVRIHLRQT